MRGDHFVFHRENGMWHWQLWGGHHPSGLIARSGHGYTTKQSAERSIASARLAMGVRPMIGGFPARAETRLNED